MVKIEIFTKVLMAIGAMTILMFIGFAFGIVINEVGNFITKNKLKYIQKHRFDKPPTAKCYCIDCKKWDKETGRCYRFDNGFRTADCWFCWEADPKEK